ncbi:hypothetical protein [Micromonospora profundi]|uniref:hypothetical protein n=1 Tax=Micromonospora profundi TaxID=1420889 RepID=UPI00364B61FD
MRFTQVGKQAAAVATNALVASALGAAPAQATGIKPLKDQVPGRGADRGREQLRPQGHDYDILAAAVGE